MRWESLSEIRDAARRDLPGYAFAERQVAAAERLMLREHKNWLDEVGDESHRASEDPSQPSTDGARDQSPTGALDGLLRRSMDQTPAESVRALFDRVLGELVPDEARILAAVSDGSTYPVVHVAAGGSADPLLQNASSVGRAAGVAAPALVPIYLSHLLRTGLVELGPEDSALGDEYDILLTDTDVQRACEEAGSAGRRSPKVTRRTVRMSALGREFWRYCRSEPGGP